MNGEYAPNDDALDDDENLELHMVDYSIGYNVIYAVFSWSTIFRRLFSIKASSSIGVYS